ncbi:MAG: hypothetical protein AAF609_13650 [Cyanobacteria bacterium P01_C01_bin.120]
MQKQFPQRIISKSEDIWQALLAGQHWSQIGGRKLQCRNDIVVFNLPSWYRLVCWIKEGLPSHSELMSHQRYNSFASNTRR